MHSVKTVEEIYQRGESMHVWEFMRVQWEKDDQTITRAGNRRSNRPIFIYLIYLSKSIQCCNVRNKETLNKLKFNDDSPKEKFLSNHSGSDTLFIDTKVSKKEKEERK